MPAAEATDVWKTYDRVRFVLEAIDLAVEPGEVVVLMGRSGSGKTTLLNILAGLEPPSDGGVHVAGENLAEMDEEARTRVRLEEVGIVFQRFHLIPELTVAENVELPMKLAGREGRRERTDDLLKFFGIEEQASAFPATLSGGETQRAAIARALGNEPSVVLADEPTANLDDENAQNALDALRSVAEELDTAVLIATHDPMARDAGDRVVHLVGGRITDGQAARPVEGAPSEDRSPTSAPGS